MTNIYAIALQIAMDAHEGQVDKAGEPYIFHPLEVAKILRDQGGTEYIQAIALLHDVLEDSEVTAEQLATHGIPLEAIRAVEALTHRKGESRADYRARIKANPDALVVKIADITHNSRPDRLHRLDPADQKRLQKKYLDDLRDLNPSLELLCTDRKDQT
jgi:(p)ppGpp synthase/HD superfamily hydrolase